MTSNYLLTGILTDFQLKLLDLIQSLREELKGAQQATNKGGEPLITLQYSYIVALFKCSHSTVKNALEALYKIELLDLVSNIYGECATYQYNPNAYRSLVKTAKKRNCTLITGRNKQRRTVSAETVIKYMTGKAIAKANKRK